MATIERRRDSFRVIFRYAGQRFTKSLGTGDKREALGSVARLSEGVVEQAMTAINVIWLDRIYSPLVTLWVFLGQALSADSSCRAAVARLIAHRLSRGQRACSAETGAYCQARKRLPEEFFAETARQTGRALQAKVDPEWLWKGRRVYAYDGTTVTMPDTPLQAQEYSCHRDQKWPLDAVSLVSTIH